MRYHRGGQEPARARGVEGGSLAHQILIVDDEPNIRHLLQQALAEESYTVQTAGSVFEALEKLHETSFALAIGQLADRIRAEAGNTVIGDR